MTNEGPGGMDVGLNRLLGAIDAARVYSPNEGDLAIVTLRMDEALAIADALRTEKARLDFVEQHALFIALDGRMFSHCQMGGRRSCIDAAIAALAPNAEAHANSCREGKHDETN